MADPQQPQEQQQQPPQPLVKDGNGNFVDSTGTPLKTEDGKQPANGTEVEILDESGATTVKGRWNGSNVVEEKEQPQ
jgi:hypothetical protein